MVKLTPWRIFACKLNLKVDYNARQISGTMQVAGGAEVEVVGDWFMEDNYTILREKQSGLEVGRIASDAKPIFMEITGIVHGLHKQVEGDNITRITYP